jgi:fatty-acyl-CoA synthase
MTEITREEMASFLSGKIAEYKIPDQVRAIASFPVTTNGKVQKFKLREMLTGN